MEYSEDIQDKKIFFIHSWCIVLSGLFFYLDYITQLAYAASTLYIIVVMVSVLSGEKYIVLIYAALSVLLTFLGFYLVPIDRFHIVPIADRIVSTLVLGFITFFCIVFINSRKEQERVWREISSIFNATPAALIMTNTKGVIELVNKSSYDLFGYGEQDTLLGNDIEMLIPDRFKQQHRQNRRSYHQSPVKRPMGKETELFALKKDGCEFPVEVGLNPIELEGETKVIASVIDITEQKKQIEILSNYAEQLKKSNSYLQEFAYVASHDLQEPLRMVSSYTQLLAQQYQDKLDEDANDFIKFAVDGAKRMQILIQDLLEFSRLSTQDIAKTSVDMNELFDAALANLTMVINESGTTVSKDELPGVSGDYGQLRQLLQNLIGNAVKYRHPDRDNRIHVSVQRCKDAWQFCVEDNGIGIQDEFYERIFEIFKRLHSSAQYSGTGIGLALCKRIVESHHGKLWVESENGQGSKFFFTLPDTD